MNLSPCGHFFESVQKYEKYTGLEFGLILLAISLRTEILKMVRRSAWLLVFILVTVSCLDEPDCYHLNNDIIGISFKKVEDGSTDTMAVAAMGTVEPPLLFYRDTSFTKLFLPLNYFQNETIFFFETADTTHLLRLQYVSQVQFVSENCGEKFVLSTMRVLEHSFDSVRLVTDTPTSEARTTHLEIFQ